MIIKILGKSTREEAKNVEIFTNYFQDNVFNHIIKSSLDATILEKIIQ